MQEEGLHHLHARRQGKSYHDSPFPHHVSWKRQLDRLMYVIAVVAPMSYAPQVYKVFTTQVVDGLSVVSFILLFVINALWFLYGVAHRSQPLIITSVLFCAFHLIIVAGILLYQ
jgi:uncharacterized protein with PQ loop repeat